MSRKGEQRKPGVCVCLWMSGRSAGLICPMHKRRKQLSISVWSQGRFWHAAMSSRHHYNTLRRTGPVHVGVDLLQAQQQTQQIKKLIKKNPGVDCGAKRTHQLLTTYRTRNILHILLWFHFSCSIHVPFPWRASWKFRINSLYGSRLMIPQRSNWGLLNTVFVKRVIKPSKGCR